MQWQQWAHCELVSCELTMLAHCDLTVYLTVRYSGWAHCDHGVSSHLHWDAPFQNVLNKKKSTFATDWVMTSSTSWLVTLSAWQHHSNRTGLLSFGSQHWTTWHELHGFLQNFTGKCGVYCSDEWMHYGFSGRQYIMTNVSFGIRIFLISFAYF